MTSPLSGATLIAQRAMNRWKTYHLAVSQPNVIFTARINQTFATLDGVKQITYDGGTGTYTNVKPGMTCWIGSSAGAFDVGIVRVRKTLTTTKVFIGITSGVALADNLYLTFVDDFQLWSCEPLVTNTLTLMDQDIVFDAQLSFAPIVKIGPIAYVLELIGATVDLSPIATIYSPIGETADTYLWVASGASATADMDTDNPTITYNAAGEYYISCTVTDTAGVSSTAYRKIFVVTSDEATISPPEISGDIDSGGWSCRVDGYSGADIGNLHDRTLCVLWKKDYVGTVRDTAYGLYPSAENIRLVGWLDGESLSINPEFGTASFTIQGPAFWLDKIPGAPMSVTDTGNTPGNWNQIEDMTTDAALYRLVYWQSTLASIMDMSFTGNVTLIKFANVNSSSLRQQIDGLAGEKLLARLAVDRFGCARVSIPQSLKDSTGKSALIVLWDCASADWMNEINITRETVDQSSMAEVGGSAYDGTIETPTYSRAPGNTLDQYGYVQAPYSSLTVVDQAEMNRLSGDILAMQNSEYPTVDIELYWPNDFIDFSDYIIRLSVASGDTPRAIVWTNKRLVPHAISFQFDPETGAESTLITFAEETTGTAGVFYLPPQPAGTDDWNPPGFDFPPFPPLVPPPYTWFPPVIPPEPTGDCGDDAPLNVFGLSFDKSEISGEDAVLSTYAYFPCKIRASSADNPSYVRIGIEYSGDALGKVHCYAIDAAKNRILTATVTPPGEGGNWYNTTLAEFDPVAETDVAGFEIELESGIGSDISFNPGDAIASGTQAADAGSDVIYGSLVADDYYAIENTGGPWTNGAGGGSGNVLSFVPDNGAGGKGIFGGSWWGFGPGFSDTLSLLVTQGDIYVRVYFKAVDVSLSLAVADNFFDDNTGSIGWILREAIVTGRKITINGGRAHNVCKAG